MYIKEIFAEQQDYLVHFFSHIDAESIERVVSSCLQKEKGLLVLTGVGKSGIIAEKIAMTLVSTGTKALYLPSSNFLHGDIGILEEGDTVFFLSKSGETEDLLSIVPFVKKRKAQVIAVVSRRESRLAQMADQVVVLPVKRELCPFDLAPTTSTQVQLLFGDALAMALMKTKQFSLQAYAANHPSGSIGRKSSIKVEDLMIRGSDLPLCQGSSRLGEVLSLLSEKKCGCLLVVNPEMQLEGIFTDGDLRRTIQIEGKCPVEASLEKLMTRKPLAISSESLAWDAIKMMQKDPKKWIMVLPVVDGAKVVGVLRMHDVIHAGII